MTTSKISQANHEEGEPSKSQNQQLVQENVQTVSALSWENVTVSIPVKFDESSSRKTRYKEKTLLLDSVSGYIKAGTLVALMGPSGAGKSTLLSLLSLRIKCKESSGIILSNGKKIPQGAARRTIGFVPQQDIAFDSLTAKEHLSFMAELSLGSGWQHSKRVDELLAELNLMDCADVRIKNLSGGERKRLALAVELLTRPAVLLCDEPCSGLDSSTALHIVRLLHQEARQRGAAIMVSLHQPAPKLLRYFDRVLVLGYKGRSKLVELTRNGDENGCEREETDDGSSKSLIDKISVDIDERNDAIDANERSNTKLAPEVQFSRLSWFRQTYLLLLRNWVTCHRRPLSARIATPLVVLLTGIFIAIFYSGYRSDPPNQAIIQDLRGVLYLISSEVMFTSAYSALGRLPGQLALLRRERGLYSLSAAYMADVLNLIPQAIFEPILLLSCAFWSIQLESLRTFSTFSAQAILLIIASLVANAYGCLLFGILGSASLASEVAAPLDLLLLLLSGMFIALPSLPRALQAMRYLSTFYYSNDALATMYWAQVPNITCPVDPDLPCLSNGTQVLQRWGFTTPPNNWTLEPTDLTSLLSLIVWDFGGLLALGAVMHLGAYIGLRRQANKDAAY